MNKIFFYMLKKYIIGFLLAALVLLGVNLLLVFISELKNIGNHNYSFITLVNYIILLIPQNFLDIFPYALLIGSMISFGSMAYHSEFIAINSHGIGIKKTMRIIIIQTFFISSFITIIANSLAPKYSNEAQSMKNIALNKGLSNNSLWFRSGDYIINVNSIITDKRLEDIMIYRIENGLLSSVLSAERGLYDIKWNFDNVEILDISSNRKIKKENHSLPTNEFIPFEILKSQFSKKRYISIQNLYRNIIFHNKINIPYENHKVVFWKKILLPVSCCIIVFVALPFLFTSMRSTNQSQRIIVGVLFGITYFVISSIVTNLGLILSIPAFLSVLLSMGVFVFFGYFLFNLLVKRHIPI